MDDKQPLVDLQQPPAYAASATAVMPSIPPLDEKQHLQQQQQQAFSSQPRPRPPPPPPLSLPILDAIRTRRAILASASPRRRALLSILNLPNLIISPSNHPEDLSKDAYAPWEYVRETATAKCLAAYRSALEDRGTPDPELVIAADTVVVGWGGEILEKPRSRQEHFVMLRGLRDGFSAGFEAGAGGRGVKPDGPGGPAMALEGVVGMEDLASALGGGMRGEKEAGPTTTKSITSSLAATSQAQATNGSSRSISNGWHKVLTAVAVLAPLESARAPGYALETTVEETGVKFDPTIPDSTLHAYIATREGADKAGGYGIQGLGGALLIEKIDGAYDNVVGMPVRPTLMLVEKTLRVAGEEAPIGGNGVGEDEEEEEEEGAL